MSRFNQSRRHFLRTASALSTMVPAAGSGLALNLATIGAAAAQSAPGDYKALVCVFLYGGCDYANTVLATDPDSWAAYLAARSLPPDPVALDLPGAATARSVLPLTNTNAAGLNGGRAFAVHPNLQGFQSLYEAGRGAVVGNVGPLVVPLTRAQYSERSVPKPPALFSHNDQQSTWMAFAPEGARVGWGGHHYVVGGAVRGRDVYGRFPVIGVNTSDDVGQGRLLPGVSVDQYAATLGKWFGLSDQQLLDIMPNLKNFGVRNLGFMV